MNFKLHLFWFIFFISCSGSQVTESDQGEITQETFTNPLLSSGADPWVLKQEDKYYYTHTTGSNLVLRETENMEDLAQAEPLVIWNPPEGKEYSHQIWAPELHYIEGKWYLYFAASYDDGTENSMDSNRRMFVLENSSDSPMNTNWTYKGKISDETDHWAIDGTVMQLEDGNYFIWSGWRTKNQPENTGRQQLYIARMKDPWTLEGERIMISEPQFDWEKNGLVNEGPVAWKNPAGNVFLFYSASGCWTDDYKLGVIQLQNEANPLDPDSWVKHPKPVFQKNSGNAVFAPGHNSLFKSPDGNEDWIIYHANDQPGEGCGSKRKPRMQKIGWDANGFPNLGIPEKTSKPIEVPAD